MKIFITGATGVVGSRAVPLMLAAGHRVSAVARRADQGMALAKAGARPVVVDLFDRESVRHAVAGHDAIINLATHLPPSTARLLLPGAWRENDRLRREAAATLAGAALDVGAERFIQESFAPVYPDRGEGWIHEDTPLEPVRFNRTVADARRLRKGLRRPAAPGSSYVSRRSTAPTPCRRSTWSNSCAKVGRRFRVPLKRIFHPCRTTTQRPRYSPRYGCRREFTTSRMMSRCAIGNSPRCWPPPCKSRRRKYCHPG